MIEYKILQTDKPEASEDQLNQFGRDGWQLVTIVPYRDEWYYYFSRHAVSS